MTNGQDLESIYRAWKDFVSGKIAALSPESDMGRRAGDGQLPVRPAIGASWERSRSYGVDPWQRANSRVLAARTLRARQEQNLELLEIALPIVEYLYQLVQDTGLAIALSDREGYLLKVIGDQYTRQFASLSNAVEGSCWAEAVMGTNGIGTPLATGEPIQVIGPEHYCRCNHPATCSGAPIRDPEGRVIGALDITGEIGSSHPHTLGMVAATARAISMQMEVRRTAQYKEAIMESLSEGVIAIDSQGAITHLNATACNLWGLKPQEALGQSLEALLSQLGPTPRANYHLTRLILAPTRLTDKMANLSSRAGAISFSLTTRPLVSACGKRVGTVLVLSEGKRLRRWLNQAMGSQARLTFSDLVGESREFIVARHLAMMASCADSNILLTGETGTGKDALAQAIHNASSRGHGPFVALNCAAIPRELIASELFGYAEGAFTGARRGGYMGKFLLANGGTMFLDEIGEMPLDMQAALLRVLEDKVITPVGSTETIPLDVRIIAASNKDLAQETRNSNFRSDLYYRLDVINIHLPPLRERRLDIPLLAQAFVERFCRRNQRAVVGISSQAMEILSSYSWPGNIRELQNVMERALVLCQEKEIGVSHLPSYLQLGNKADIESGPASRTASEKLSLRSLEAEAIRACLARCSGNRALAARELGIARSTLYRKLKQLG